MMMNQITWTKFTSFDELPKPQRGCILHTFSVDEDYDRVRSYTAEKVYGTYCWYTITGEALKYYIQEVEDWFVNQPTHWALTNVPEEVE